MKPVSNASKDTQKRILDIAEQLLLTRGFNAFSYQHISSALGVRNAAVHYHFPRKTDLGVALVQRYRRRFARFMEAHASLDPLQQLEGYFELTDAYFQQDEQICPSGILTTEYHTLPEEIQLEANAFITEMRDWAKTIARRGRDERVMTYPGTPEAMGEVMFAALQGGLQLARIDAGILDTIKQQIRDLLKVEKS
ncbi:TetR/AcrR family transcriptional regulator [Pseudogulbenkiania subflava]|uniref:Transcriptional regulator, TetR family n=1 Tax=Pseudogulbenkiania subflava DSM 22618 TaxID=1123014 RepID=A0A1Y6C8T5_9NEIS|nr:TetR/AcrR family transcriptional regulator [Pseudogulbenkiania subflava]SMF49590.1 transcriptional regulator, TetR family [Pseudogulbenkiania subflava DSM 22618]